MSINGFPLKANIVANIFKCTSKLLVSAQLASKLIRREKLQLFSFVFVQHFLPTFDTPVSLLYNCVRCTYSKIFKMKDKQGSRCLSEICINRRETLRILRHGPKKWVAYSIHLGLN